jgi:hypothetical protein
MESDSLSSLARMDIGGRVPPLGGAMHDRPAHGVPMESDSLPSLARMGIGGHAPPLLDGSSPSWHTFLVNSDPSAYPELRFLGEFSEIQEFRNRLPHWCLEKAACFMTFRLADSLPAALLSEWRREREQWLSVNPKAWNPATVTAYHKQFSTRID